MNVTKWLWPAVPLPPDAPDAWEVLLHLSAIFMGMIGRSTKDIDDVIFRQLAAVAVKNDCPWSGLTVDEVMGKLDGMIGPERIIDMLVRLGSYGDGFGRRPDGLTLAKVQANVHGVDLGPMPPRLREIINTQSSVIELAPPMMINDIAPAEAHGEER